MGSHAKIAGATSATLMYLLDAGLGEDDGKAYGPGPARKAPKPYPACWRARACPEPHPGLPTEHLTPRRDAPAKAPARSYYVPWDCGQGPRALEPGDEAAACRFAESFGACFPVPLSAHGPASAQAPVSYYEMCSAGAAAASSRRAPTRSIGPALACARPRHEAASSSLDVGFRFVLDFSADWQTICVDRVQQAARRAGVTVDPDNLMVSDARGKLLSTDFYYMDEPDHSRFPLLVRYVHAGHTR